jgi:hypothetical protein
MVKKLTFNSQATALVDISADSMPIARSLKTRDIMALCFSGLLLSQVQGAPV